MTSGPGESRAERLDGWKQIAAYLQRGVRTVRRWEREEGLPVHRHVHRVLGSVYAYQPEIDAWQRWHRDLDRPTHRSGDRSGDRARLSPRPGRTGPRDGAAREPSIAVLSFANLSADPENAYFADGLADEITADLARTRALRVISRTSSATFRGAGQDARAIGHALGARYLLEGSVRRAGGRLRVSARLIDAGADRALWSETFDGAVEDVFAIQERVARVVVGALEVRLTTDEERRLLDRGIDDAHAYACYLRARQQGWRWRRDAIDQAVQLLRNGLAIVGDNARLYAALGVAHLQYREAGIDFGDAPLVEAEACARKLAALGPSSAAGLQLRGWIHYARARLRHAVHDLEAALDLEPNDADTLLLLSNCYLISGRVPAARPLIERSLALDPLTPLTRCMPAWASVLEGDLAAALGPYGQMFEMDPGNPMARLFYVWVLLLNAREEAIPGLLAAFPPEVRDTVPARVARFLAGAVRGGGRERPLPPPSPEVHAAAGATDVFARFVASGYARAGDASSAMHWLEVAVDRGFINHHFLARVDPSFASLRREPRFIRLMDKARGRSERFET
jgi:TolB-like protein